MFSPEEQQMQICLLKSNLETIENDVLVQHSALPMLEDDSKKIYENVKAISLVVRSLNTEMEKLKQENVRLTVKRLQLKRECDEVSMNLQTAHKNREHLKDSLKDEQTEIDLLICQYENCLYEKADRFRSTHEYYNGEEVNKKLEDVNRVIAELQVEVTNKQIIIDELKMEAEGIFPKVPEDLLEICGKPELDEKVKLLTEKFEALSAKWKKLLQVG